MAHHNTIRFRNEDKVANSDDRGGVAAKLASALSSADRVVRDLNAAHSKNRSASPVNGSSSGVHPQTDSLDSGSQKRS